MAKNPHDTPAMRQFKHFKEQHPDCILFFRMGDFYELFYDDAKIAAKAIGLTLTQRTTGIPMAGVPYHSVDNYLRRMIEAGYRVAICDQVEDAAQAKGVVKRDVTRVVTPGTLTEDSLLDESTANHIAAVMFSDAGDTPKHAHMAYAELSTGAFHVASMDASLIADELARLGPRELLFVETANNVTPPRIKNIADAINCPVTPRPAWQFRLADALDTLKKQFQVKMLSGFGIDDDDPIIAPAGAVVSYLLETQKAEGGRLPHLLPPKRYQQTEHLVIDRVSLRALEVERTMRSGEVDGSLLGALQKCHTAMGKRLLRQWLCYPLTDKSAIIERQQAVGAMIADPDLSEQLTEDLSPVQDVQRITARIAINRCSPRDLVALGKSLHGVEQLNERFTDRPAFEPFVNRLAQISAPLNKLSNQLEEACVESPPAHLREGGLLQDGYDKQLDEYRELQRDSNKWLAEYQAKLTKQLDIPTLKVGYNKVFGYYIEITHAHTAKVSDAFTRKQTLKNAERYITPELKEYEDKVLGASQKAVAREQHLFEELCKVASSHLEALHEFSQIVAEIDVLHTFALRAVRYKYVRPEIVDQPVLKVIDGKHPVLDELLADQFVPNDIELSKVDGTQALITGPNMAGKSTYIRQAALLTLLAHTGSYIPASSATIGLTDRIFTRIGASDELHTGQSTFMVEMTETANICHHATANSLVILDEIGRGTSTYDGLSLAWAIAEHLAEVKARTLFATHYHELTQLSELYENVRNLNVTVREWGDQIVFLHRIAPGGTDRSYGIHVAKIAGLPKNVIDRARDLMSRFESNPTDFQAPADQLKQSDAPPPDTQMSLFTEYIEHPAVEELKEADLNNLTPLEAFDLLRNLQSELREE